MTEERRYPDSRGIDEPCKLGVDTQRYSIDEWVKEVNGKLIWRIDSFSKLYHLIESVECWAVGAGSVIFTIYKNGTLDIHTTCPDAYIEECFIDAELRCLVAEESNTR